LLHAGCQQLTSLTVEDSAHFRRFDGHPRRKHLARRQRHARTATPVSRPSSSGHAHGPIYADFWIDDLYFW
jgi:hypothetical protein